jgi:phosphoribosyl-ATP pyrophosphohydrolase/phosphoribosyl-AMP cyclohydrolase
MVADCDCDTLLIMARPVGSTCHTGKKACFGEVSGGLGFLLKLEQLIYSRKVERPIGSYTTSLFDDGLNQIVEKIAEESEEVTRAAIQETRERLIEESADLLFHLMVLLAQKEVGLTEVMNCLESRNES